MATYTIGEAMSLIKGYLDKVSADAETYMRSYIKKNATRGYATDTLADSINTEKLSESTRSVGSSLKSKSGFTYGLAVDKGRRPITKDPGFLQYYDPVHGRWVKTHHVDKMDGINFVQETKDYIERTHIPL